MAATTGQAGLDQLLGPAAAIGKQHLAHYATVTVHVPDGHRDRLLEDQCSGQLLPLRTKGLRLLGRARTWSIVHVACQRQDVVQRHTHPETSGLHSAMWTIHIPMAHMSL
jgi:hypothetical protein